MFPETDLRELITTFVYCCFMNSSHRLRFSEGRNSLINLLASSSHSSFASAEKPRNSLSFSFERRWLYGIFFFGVSFILMFHVFYLFKGIDISNILWSVRF